MTNQTRPTPGAAILGAPTKTDRNSPTDADTPCPVQFTMLGTKSTATEEQAGELDALRSLRNHIRTDFKGILTSSDRLLISESCDVTKLKANLENLQQIRSDLIELDSDIFNLVEEEIEQEVEEVDRYTLCFFRANAYLQHWLQCLKNKQPLDIKSTSFSEMTVFLNTPREFLYSFVENMPSRHNGDGDNLPSSMELGETETPPIEPNVAQAPGETRIEQPSLDFEYICVPDFMKGESFPQLPETSLDAIDEVWEVAPVRQHESLHQIRVEKPEQPQLIAADQHEAIATPDREKAASLFPLTFIVEITSSESETTDKKTGAAIGMRETDGRASSNSGHKNYSKTANPLKVVRGRIWNSFTTDTGHAVWFCGTSRWRRSALLRLRRRLQHRWKRKRCPDLTTA